MINSSALYVGRVTHHRLRPRRHSLSYRAYWLLLDLDEIDRLSQTLVLFSRNRFNVFSFHDADHGNRSEPLRAQVERHLSAANINLGGGAIRLLTMPRLLGYVFNPLSIYFCHHRDGALAALLYEVSNTFGERHTYLIGVPPLSTAPIRQTCNKLFYVSPFLGMEMRYHFHVTPPSEKVAVTVRGSGRDGDMIVATLSGNRARLTDSALLRVLVTHPLLTTKVMIGIHWEALQLWLKGLRIHARRTPPSEAVSIHKRP